MINPIVKYSLLVILINLLACNGRLSDEQRKKLLEGMKRNQIKKISEARITEASFAFGRHCADQIGNTISFDTRKKNSIENSQKVKIRLLFPGDVHLSNVEKQIIEAYEGTTDVQPPENVQRFGKDSILYTKPFMKELPDGSFKFKGAIGVSASIKEIVLSIKD